MKLQKAKEICDEIVGGVSEYFVSEETVLRKMLAACVSNGHILFEDYPGLGKTLLVKTFTRVSGLDYRRIQFTPDLLPADIIGTNVWRQGRGAFELVKGPVFTNIVLADEINRAPPKTQSALLEAMEERQVSMEGTTHPLGQPFIVLATQNPIELEGTYPLPEAQMDRFMIRLSTGYQRTLEAESLILKRRIEWKKDDPTPDIEPVIDIKTFRSLLGAAESIHVDESIIDYISRIVRKTREHPKVEIGSSPRGGLALLKVSKALALMKGRDFITPDDVKSVAPECLVHRLILKMEYALKGYQQREVVEEVLGKVPVESAMGEGDAH